MLVEIVVPHFFFKICMLHRDFQLFSVQPPNSLVNSKQESELLNAPKLHLRKCPVLLLPRVPWNSKVKQC